MPFKARSTRCQAERAPFSFFCVNNASAPHRPIILTLIILIKTAVKTSFGCILVSGWDVEIKIFPDQQDQGPRITDAFRGAGAL
jgi:hypothetical protein